MRSFQTRGLIFTLKSLSTTTDKAAIQEHEHINPLTAPLPAHIKKQDASTFIITCYKFPILSLVERFDPTDNGKIMYPFKETYDYRESTHTPNPPTWIDAFIVDLSYVYKHKDKWPDLITGRGTKLPKKLGKQEILQVFQVYLNAAANDIVGYRPWTHSRFLKSLNDSDRNLLAKESEAYIEKYGFREK